MTISTTNKILGWGLVLAALAVLVRRVWLMELDSFEFDDAFMFIRYAENILAGSGYTWNAGDPPVYGCTSILYTYVIAATYGIFKGVGASKVLVGTAFIFGAGFLWKLQAGLHKTMKSDFFRDRLVIGLFTIPLLVFPLIFGFHISTGMETTLSLLLNAVFIFSVLRYSEVEQPGLRSAVVPALAGILLFLVRPDNAVVIALFPLLYLSTRQKIRHFYLFALCIAVFFAVDIIVKYFVFGSFLPLSFYAKKSGFSEGYTAKYFWNPVKYLTQFVAYMMPYILAIFAFAQPRHRRLLLSFLLPVGLTFLYYFSFDQVMGFDARLYFPFIPYMVIAAFMIADDAIQNKEDQRALLAPNVLLGKFILLLVFLVLTVFSKYRFINMYESWAIKTGNRDAIEIPDLLPRKYNRENSIRIISELLKEFPDDLVFAATEHGFISGDNPHKRIVDLSGLHNEVIAREGYTDALLEEEQPDLIWMPHQDLTVLHHTIRTGAYFQLHYEYISHVFAFGCAVRKDSKYYNALKERIH